MVGSTLPARVLHACQWAFFMAAFAFASAAFASAAALASSAAALASAAAASEIHSSTAPDSAELSNCDVGLGDIVGADVGTVDSGLNSVVLASNNERVLLPLNEPTYGTARKSQIQTYLEQNGGPGLQHLALRAERVRAVDEGVDAELQRGDARAERDGVPGAARRRRAGAWRSGWPS